MAFNGATPTGTNERRDMPQSPGLDPHLCLAVLWVSFPWPGLCFGQAPGTRVQTETNQGLLAVSP